MDTLFSLPIYSCPSEKFEKLFEKHILNKAKSSYYYPSDIETAKRNVRKFEWKKGIWKYNQIVGYLEVFVLGGSLAFRCYIPEERTTRFSNVKKYFRLVEIYGMYIQLTGTNKTIAHRLLEVIKSIQRKNKWYIDYSLFNRVYENIDYLNLK